MTTVYPLLEFVQAVAGDRGEARLLLPPGAGVHTWQPRAGDILKLTSSDLIVRVGLGLEPWLDGILRGLRPASFRVLDIGRGLPPEKDGSASAHDPHVWLDFGLDLLIIEAMREALTEIEPESAAYFRTNADAYAFRLEDLDRRFQEGLASCRQRPVIVGGHAAFGRLLARYGLQQVPLYGLSPDAEPTPSRLAEIVRLARARGIRTVYMEAGEPARLADALCREIGARRLLLNAGHNPSPEDLGAGRGFIELMIDNLESLRNGCRED
ncbi:MAG: zinc ABC transporter substrate-binding protein [Candidatus Aminicenantes bacterium]|nr:zinc ABC transporter substrate-binding protein [Candidatus Aminicenantes bacterium]